MHDTAYRIGGLVMEVYLPTTPARILEVGAHNVNGTLRDHAPRNAEYIGLDFEKGDGVDVVVTDITDWAVPDSYFDLVMASSVFEHDKTFWRTFIAMCGKAKPGGHIYISAPSNGTFHRYPKDYWRFYPDSGLALEEWARSEGLDVTLIESFVAEREGDVWNDYCAIFRRGPSDADFNREFIFSKISSTNAQTWRSSLIINPTDDSQDTRLLSDAREETRRWVQHSDFLNAQHAARERSWDEERARLTTEIAKQTRDIESLDQAASEKIEQSAALEARANDLQAQLNQLNAEVHLQTEQRDQQARQLNGELGELQSRLAQREEEAAQAWAEVRKQEQEREQLAAELHKVQNDLVDAKAWVERLALTRTVTERSVVKLEKALAKAVTDSARTQRRNEMLEEHIAALSERSSTDNLPRDHVNVAVPAVPLTASIVAHDDGLAEATLRATRAELSENRARLSEALADLSSSKFQLKESRDDIVLLSNMLAQLQDETAALEHQNEWLREAARFLLERGKWWWRFMPLAWQRRKRDRRLLNRKLFDCETYTSRYPDIAASGQDPFRHYLFHGVTENRRYD